MTVTIVLYEIISSSYFVFVDLLYVLHTFMRFQ